MFNKEMLMKKSEKHPCYSCAGGNNARMHLPIAPKCNIQCNYCVRKYDCTNESRPGVTSEVLTPKQAVEKFAEVKAKMPNLTVVGIAGPGDTLANFDEVRECLKSIREIDKDIMFCISTNGLMLPKYAKELYELGVTHITVTMNTIDPDVGAQIYKHITYEGKSYTGREGAEILLKNQLEGLKIMSDLGAICKVNSVALKGINDSTLIDVTKKSKELGAYISNIIPHIPVKDSGFENLDRLTSDEINKIRDECSINIKQMRHCKQCRADAIGTLSSGGGCSSSKGGCKINNDENVISVMPKKEIKSDKLRIAVSSTNGNIPDVHFGQTKDFYIYESKGTDISFVGKRTVPSGDSDVSEDDKIERIISVIFDCDAVITSKIGNSPIKKLASKGIDAFVAPENMYTADVTMEYIKKAL